MFTYSASGEETYISVVDAAGYARVSGTNIDSVVFDSYNMVSLNGNDMQYEAVYGTGVNGDALETYSGSATGFITVS